ncbi:MAG: isoprenyl transferase [Oscillospiraceae bacterium]
MAAKKLNDGIVIPTHVGIIMDGNGRWAKKRGLPRKAGHYQGAKAFRKIVKYCSDIGIKYATFYAFSTENWSRPQDEVDSIMKLMDEYLDDAKNFYKENVRTILIGDKSRLDPKLQAKINKVEEDSKDFTGMTLLIAINYGGQDEIVHAARKIAEKAAKGELSPDDITKQTISDNLYTAGIPDADLIIRPSGEYRTSNFLLWQSAYAEYVFMDNVLWPDFSEKEMEQALEEYSKRNRRFGGV